MKIRNITAEFGDHLVTNNNIIQLNPAIELEKLSSKVGVEKRYWSTSDKWPSVINSSILKFAEANSFLNKKKCVVISVCQTGKRRFPGYSNEIQNKLGISPSSFCIDLSMGCSGYVYALYLAQNTMKDLGYEYAIIHTADAYNMHINKENSAIFPLFGAASTITLLEPSLRSTKYDFMSSGESWDKLTFIEDQINMNGAAVYQYVAWLVSKRLKKFISSIYLDEDKPITLYLHQASKITLDMLVQNLNLGSNFLIPRNLFSYGNCTSSSIPLLILDDLNAGRFTESFFASGFGVGLSYGAVHIGVEL
jgi:3-oxoacyl-[acyl-carrier-protein] synthase-3